MRISGAWLLLAMAMPAAAHDEWTDADTVREAINVSLFAYDAYQTNALLHSNVPCSEQRGPVCHQMHESNPLLGRNPSGTKLAVATLIGSAVHAGIAYALPRGWREAWQYVTIGIEVAVINHNSTVHVGVNF